MSTLDKIAKLYGTDKSSEIHNYSVKYEKYLPFKRYELLNILEIGVLDGKSLNTWSDYYYQSTIIGIDINQDCKKYQDENKNIFVEIGDQTNNTFLEKVVKEYGPFDMIFDDGSHINYDVIYTFNNLFPSVKSGGVYIVEDSCTSYWSEYGGGYLNVNSTMEHFKKLSDDINFRGLLSTSDNVHSRREDKLITLSHQVQPQCRTDIESITFLNSIILITKR